MARLSGPKEIGIYPETGEMITFEKVLMDFICKLVKVQKKRNQKEFLIPKNFGAR